MKWFVLLLVLSGCDVDSVTERSIKQAPTCAADCEFLGASSYAINLLVTPQCTCIFKLRGRR